MKDRAISGIETCFIVSAIALFTVGLIKHSRDKNKEIRQQVIEKALTQEELKLHNVKHR
jgi:predicted nucleic-acid-binding protein